MKNVTIDSVKLFENISSMSTRFISMFLCCLYMKTLVEMLGILSNIISLQNGLNEG